MSRATDSLIVILYEQESRVTHHSRGSSERDKLIAMDVQADFDENDDRRQNIHRIKTLVRAHEYEWNI